VLIGNVTYFAPGVPFEALDLSGKQLPDQLLARMEGYYLGPAERCIKVRDAFAAGVLLVTCIDAISRFDFGPNRAERKVGKDFSTFVRIRLPSFRDQNMATLLYKKYRNGLVHEARLKEGCQFSFGLKSTLDISRKFPVVDPSGLLRELRSAVSALVQEMRDSKAFQKELLKYVRREFAYEIGAADAF